MINRNKCLAKSNLGFTLIELLVAMTIMAVLAGIGLYSYQGVKKTARDSKRKVDMEQIRSALEIYRNDCQTYPGSLGVQLRGVNPVPTPCSIEDVYLQTVPQDPGECQYYYASSAGVYKLCASLENGGSADPNCLGASCGSGTGCICNYSVSSP